MRAIRPLPPVCRALLAVEPGESLGLPERQRSVLWAYMRECEDYDATTDKALRMFARGAK